LEKKRGRVKRKRRNKKNTNDKNASRDAGGNVGGTKLNHMWFGQGGEKKMWGLHCLKDGSRGIDQDQPIEEAKRGGE